MPIQVSPGDDGSLLFTLDDFRQGVDTRSSPTKVTPTRLPDAANVLLAGGYPQRISGSTLYETGMVMPDGKSPTLHAVWKDPASEAVKHLFCGQDGHAYVFDSGSMVNLRRGLDTTAGLWWSDTQLADVLVIGDGIDANHKYDGTRLLPLGAKHIADMESTEATWVGGTANTDGTYIKQGTQSRSLTADAYETATMTLTPDESWDLTTGILSAANGGVDYGTSDYIDFWVYIDGVDELVLASSYVRFTDDDSAGYYQLLASSWGSLDDGWNKVHVLKSAFSQSGYPDWAAIGSLTFVIRSLGESPSSTPSHSVSATPSSTASSTASSTVSSTVSATPSSTPSSTGTTTPSSTPSSTPSTTPTATPSQSSTPSSTPSNTPSSTVSSTPSGTATPSSTPSTTPSATPSSTPSATPSASPEASVTCYFDDVYMIYATPMPPCQVVFAWKEMLLGMDSTEEESGIHYSIVAGPDIYDANAVTTIGKGDGTKITGAFQGYGDQLIVTKSNSVHPVSVRLTGEPYPDYIFASPRALTNEHGCDSHRSIVEAAGNYYMWWNGKIYRYKGVGTERVSYLFDAPASQANGPTIASVNMARATQIVGASLRDLNIVLWCYPTDSDTANADAVLLDYIENGVVFVEGVSAATALTLRDDAGVEALLTATNTGRVLEQNRGTTFDGSSVLGRVTLPWMHHADHMISWHEAHISYDTQTSGTLLVEYRIARHEREFDAASWVQAASIDMSATAEYGKVPIGEIAPWCQIRVRTAADPFTLYWPVKVIGADLGIVV